MIRVIHISFAQMTVRDVGESCVMQFLFQKPFILQDTELNALYVRGSRIIDPVETMFVGYFFLAKQSTFPHTHLLNLNTEVTKRTRLSFNELKVRYVRRVFDNLERGNTSSI